MLYDDANQVEVRYVISLAHHDVSIYGGEGEIPEGELWLKRNAISLSRRLDSLADRHLLFFSFLIIYRRKKISISPCFKIKRRCGIL